ncbi:hypothetical protein [Okeania hirsuta]|uniref:hypothetical protein n=1 Tax=Okeania hirsuta TaxID=1458930 RepID=UPI001961985C|nr:hypothetical protein [Okeania hirsuta]
MVFYITISKTKIRYRCPFKLIEDLLIGFAHDVGEYIKTASVCHPNNDLFDLILSRFVDDAIQSSDSSFAPSNEKRFVSYVFGMEELFEYLRFRSISPRFFASFQGLDQKRDLDDEIRSFLGSNDACFDLEYDDIQNR